MTVRKTKARIMRRETTVPKVPEDPEEEEKLKRGKAGGKVDPTGVEKAEDKVEEMSDEESDDGGSEEERAPKTNGKSIKPTTVSTVPTATRLGEEFIGRCQEILETRMTEIQQVFEKGIPYIRLKLTQLGKDKEALAKAKGIASDIVAMTTVLLQETD